MRPVISLRDFLTARAEEAKARTVRLDAARKAGASGRSAAPMSSAERASHYGREYLTPAQARRFRHKIRRAQRLNGGAS